MSWVSVGGGYAVFLRASIHPAMHPSIPVSNHPPIYPLSRHRFLLKSLKIPFLGCSSHGSLNVIIAPWPLSEKGRKSLCFLGKYSNLPGKGLEIINTTIISGCCEYNCWKSSISEVFSQSATPLQHGVSTNMLSLGFGETVPDFLHFCRGPSPVRGH